jgi:hypothetical protein
MVEVYCDSDLTEIARVWSWKPVRYRMGDPQQLFFPIDERENNRSSYSDVQ